MVTAHIIDVSYIVYMAVVTFHTTFFLLQSWFKHNDKVTKIIHINK